jgi:Do/DeqQ family serine protease
MFGPYSAIDAVHCCQLIDGDQPTMRGRTVSQLSARTAALALLSLGASVGLELGTSAEAQLKAPPRSKADLQYSYAPIVKKAAPAVVNVYVSRRVREAASPLANDPIFRELFGRQFGLPTERMQNSLGSGVIVSADGVIVTNNHVIQGSGAAEIRIALSDRREFDARILLQDPKTDIAILKIQSEKPVNFAFLEFDDSDGLEVGDIVLAIGNPFGVGQTVTQGIVSALARGGVGQMDGQVYIQTDAAINPGNSGGALVDMEGRLIGINTAIYSQSGGSHGIGFAIPSNLVRLFVQSAISGKQVARPWLGAKLEAVTREIAEALGLDRSSGAFVEKVYRQSPALAAGLKTGDVILAVDGKEVADPRALVYRLTTMGVGGRARLDIMRDGKRFTADVALQKAPGRGLEDAAALTGVHPFGGATVAELSPALADELGLEGADSGVIITEVRQGTPAGQLGLRAGDIIVSVGGAAMTNVAELDKALKRTQRRWALEIRRGNQLYQLAVPG